MSLEDILFLDIETVPQYSNFEEAPEKYKQLWSKKSKQLATDSNPADFFPKAGIYAEFGKIICISVGFIYMKNNERHFRLKSFASENEVEVLTELANLINTLSVKSEVMLCAHNGKEFDFPYIARRMLINNIPLPKVLQVAGKKPWEVSFIDTLELWKFGDYKHYTSLDLLAYIFNIPTPKDDIDGSQVHQVFYEEKDLDRIVIYCEKDVLAIAQLYLRYQGQALIEENNVERV